MSSTNRGDDRHKYDYYVTPKSEIRKFMNEFKYEISKDDKILDPCAGGDRVNDMSYPSVLNEYGFNNLITFDIREDSKAEFKLDYLTSISLDKYDVIITNPPFNLSMEFLKKALLDVREGGKVVMLLRLNYYGSKTRNEFLRNNMPSQCYVHGKRLSFTNDGKTDSIEYAHFVWTKGLGNKTTELHLLPFE